MALAQLAENQEVSLDSYLILPGRAYGNYKYPELLVSMDKAYHGKDWYETHQALHSEGSFMLNPRQFIDFLDLLKSGKKMDDGNRNKADSSRVQAVLDEIMGKRKPWRAEWLDAYFANVEEDMHMLYNHRMINGRLLPTKAEPLEKCLMEYDYADLGSANRQGLPIKKSRSQEIYFLYPEKDAIAGFGADFDRVRLFCCRDPSGSNRGLGVRSAKIFHRK